MKDIEDKICNVNRFRISTANSTAKNPKANSNNDFKVEVIVNNTLTKVMAYTLVNICSLQQVKKWNLTEKMLPSNIRLKPFDNNPIKVEGQTTCVVTFGSNSVPVKWHIITSDYEPFLEFINWVQL